MADQPQVEEVKPEAKAEEGNKEAAPAEKKAMNPFIPVAIMLVMMPVLSFVMTDFVLIPRMKSALEKSLKVAVDVSKKNTEAAAGSEKSDEQTYSKTFKNIVANLSGSMQSRYIKVSFTAEGHNEDFEEIMDTNEAKIVDAALGILSSLTVAQLEQPGIQNTVRNDLMTAFTNVLQKDMISQIYFSEFVVQ